MWPCCRPVHVVLPTWAAREPHLFGPWSAFTSFTTSRTIYGAARVQQLSSSFPTSRRTSRIQPIILKRSRGLKVYSFKGNSETDEGSRDGHRSSKKNVSLSCSQQEREDIVDSASSIRNHASLSPERKEETITGSQAVENLFKKWLILLQSQIPNSVEEQIHKEESGQKQSSETDSKRQEQLVGNLLKAVFLRIWELDAEWKIPLLIIPPAYLAVGLVYGAEVAQDLTPVWVLGPVFIALYINIIRRICSLYAFCFRHTKNLVLNLPTYCMVTASFIGEGKLIACIWLPIEIVKNMDYKEFFQQKWKRFRERQNEKWVDYLESIWPYYCRAIRFLKRANLV